MFWGLAACSHCCYSCGHLAWICHTNQCDLTGQCYSFIILPAVSVFVCFLPAEVVQLFVFVVSLGRSAVPQPRWHSGGVQPSPASAACSEPSAWSCPSASPAQPCPAPARSKPRPLTGALVKHMLGGVGLSLSSEPGQGGVYSSALGVKNSHTEKGNWAFSLPVLRTISSAHIWAW